MTMPARVPHAPPDRPMLTEPAVEVRRFQCTLCGAPPLEVCQRSPRPFTSNAGSS
jgi:hypothetical protein